MRTRFGRKLTEASRAILPSFRWRIGAAHVDVSCVAFRSANHAARIRDNGYGISSHGTRESECAKSRRLFLLDRIVQSRVSSHSMEYITNVYMEWLTSLTRTYSAVIGRGAHRVNATLPHQVRQSRNNEQRSDPPLLTIYCVKIRRSIAKYLAHCK